MITILHCDKKLAAISSASFSPSRYLKQMATRERSFHNYSKKHIDFHVEQLILMAILIKPIIVRALYMHLCYTFRKIHFCQIMSFYLSCQKVHCTIIRLLAVGNHSSNAKKIFEDKNQQKSCF